MAASKRSRSAGCVRRPTAIRRSAHSSKRPRWASVSASMRVTPTSVGDEAVALRRELALAAHGIDAGRQCDGVVLLVHEPRLALDSQEALLEFLEVGGGEQP